MRWLKCVALCLCFFPAPSWPGTGRMYFSVDDAFLPGMTSLDAWEAVNYAGRTVTFPQLTLELDGKRAYQGQLSALGHPKSHMYFAIFDVAPASGRTTVELHIVISPSGLQLRQRVNLMKGPYFVIRQASVDGGPVSVVLEQRSERLFYK
ncbi:MAG TPA: hypothetical protein VH208_02145 [Myxococcaceae bacterium]|nr:hypothetical protein [Myxococcaceae bacterium]